LFLEASPEDRGKRIDVWLSEKTGLSRSGVQKILKQGGVTLAPSGERPKPSYRLKGGEKVELALPPEERLELEPEPLPLDIVYEDEDLMVINKPQGMVVHPAPGHARGTLVHALLHHCQNIRGLGPDFRPGIVHRLDKDTSGLLVVAKSQRAYESLAAQLKRRTMKRVYLALVHGRMKSREGVIEAPIGRHSRDRKRMAVTFRSSRPALTFYRVLEEFDKYTLIEARLFTGRTHQIRVHLSHMGNPVVGDRLYGPKSPATPGQLLHAACLGFVHPTRQEYMEFTAPLPGYFQRFLELLREAKENGGRVADSSCEAHDRSPGG